MARPHVRDSWVPRRIITQISTKQLTERMCVDGCGGVVREGHKFGIEINDL